LAEASFISGESVDARHSAGGAMMPAITIRQVNPALSFTRQRQLTTIFVLDAETAVFVPIPKLLPAEERLDLRVIGRTSSAPQ
jgi:hypothetical protein